MIYKKGYAKNMQKKEYNRDKFQPKKDDFTQFSHTHTQRHRRKSRKKNSYSKTHTRLHTIDPALLLLPSLVTVGTQLFLSVRAAVFVRRSSGTGPDQAGESEFMRKTAPHTYLHFPLERVTLAAHRDRPVLYLCCWTLPVTW